MPSINNAIFGPYVFSSGYNPTHIGGPNRDTYLVEHAIPASEGGIVEYVGSPQPTYQIRGFISPPDGGAYNGVASAVLSGAGYVGINADDSLAFLTGLRGSGANLLRIESTSTNYSGYPVLYENDFFYIHKLTFAVEAGKTYPYYPYSMECRRASTRTFGQSSGTTQFQLGSRAYFSGYAAAFTWRSGFFQGGLLIGLGFYAVTVASGSARMAVYNVSGPQGTSQGLVAQSASQAVTSGWNYFPIRPILLAMTSGNFYSIGLMSNITGDSGFTTRMIDAGATSGTSSYQSGITYSNGFPDPLAAGNSLVSGIQLNAVMVTV